MRAMRLLAVAGILILLGGCDKADSLVAAQGNPRRTSPIIPVDSFPDNPDGTVITGPVTIEFADGNRLFITSTGVGVLISGRAAGHTSQIGFGTGEVFSVGATDFVFDLGQRATITGSRTNGQALSNLLTVLRDKGIINNSSTP